MLMQDRHNLQLARKALRRILSFAVVLAATTSTRSVPTSQTVHFLLIPSVVRVSQERIMSPIIVDSAPIYQLFAATVVRALPIQLTHVVWAPV